MIFLLMENMEGAGRLPVPPEVWSARRLCMSDPWGDLLVGESQGAELNASRFSVLGVAASETIQIPVLQG